MWAYIQFDPKSSREGIPEDFCRAPCAPMQDVVGSAATTNLSLPFGNENAFFRLTDKTAGAN